MVTALEVLDRFAAHVRFEYEARGRKLVGALW
jgi:hypothetical protein